VSKKIQEIKTAIEAHFKVTKIEWDSSAAAFHIREEEGVMESFEKIRRELKALGYITALREDEASISMKETIDQLATTPQLKEIAQKVKDADQSEIRIAWLERFFELATCPDCGSGIHASGTDITCHSCDWGNHQTEKGGMVIIVTHLPKISTRSVRVNVALLITTIITTTITGSTLWMGYRGEDFSDSFTRNLWTASTTPEFLLMGALFFSLPLMVILGTHEFGHYYMSKRYGVNASLPFFIPIPPGVSILGTMGAFISMREPIPNKKALFDIGIAGPIAGLIVAIPVTIIGFLLTEPVEHIYTPGHGPNVAIGFPLLFSFLYIFFTPDGGLHPTAFAGWVGLFVTALNLLPAGQLDGGHVARALLGEKCKYLSYTTLALMLIVGSFFYTPWLILGLLILFIGAYHPPPLNDLADLDMKRKAVGVFSIVLLVLCFTPQPIVPLEYDVHVFAPITEATLEPGDEVNFTIYIENTGEVNNTYDIKPGSVPDHWTMNLSRNNITLEAKEDDPDDSKAPVFVHVHVPANATPQEVVELKIKVISQNESTSTFGTSTPKDTITFSITVKLTYDVSIRPRDGLLIMEPYNTTQTSVLLENTGGNGVNITLHTIFQGEDPGEWDVDLERNTAFLAQEDSITININITTGDVKNGSSNSIVFIVMLDSQAGMIMDHEYIIVEVREAEND